MNPQELWRLQQRPFEVRLLWGRLLDHINDNYNHTVFKARAHGTKYENLIFIYRESVAEKFDYVVANTVQATAKMHMLSEWVFCDDTGKMMKSRDGFIPQLTEAEQILYKRG